MKSLTTKIKQYLFEPRFHFSRFEFNLIALLFITVGLIAGTYLTLSNVIPKIFALNDTNKNWNFATATASNYTYDTSLITVDNTGAHPVSGVNKFTNPAFASNNTGWSVAAVPPSGWVEVPGNSSYGTTNFLSMKYEAKCAANATPTVGLTSPDSGYHTYSDSTTACTSANTSQVVSVASGYPIANISHTNAVTRCSTVSVGSTTAHLIRNDEWMTIARDAEAQAGNWSLGSVGSGYLYAGHNDNSPALALAASTTDTGNNACAYTDSAGTTEAPAGCPTNTASGQSATAGNQKRVFTLSNGAYIWDIAGNVWEHVQRSTSNSGDTTTNMTTLPACSDNAASWGWCQYANGLSPYVSSWTSDVPSTNGPSHSTYESDQGVGQVYTFKNGTGQSTSVFLRGGGWRHLWHGSLCAGPELGGWQYVLRCGLSLRQ